MRHRVLWVAAVFAAVAFAASPAARAAVLLYSFEAPPVNPDGFGPNGGGVTVTQDTVGATVGTHSLNMTVVTPATFVGALTSVVPPALNDPPGVLSILADMTVSTPFAGAFAVVGVTMFGASQPGPGQQFGLQAQFSDIEHVEGKAPGTYPIQIDLVGATHPLTFAGGQTFNQIFGTVGSGANDLIPTGFQFFLNKSGDAPITVYFDNVRAVNTPEPTALTAMLAAGIGALVVRRSRGRRCAG